jgi:hypothetical protein
MGKNILSVIEEKSNTMVSERLYHPRNLEKLRKKEYLVSVNEKDAQFRPDVLSIAYYTTRKYWMLILKLNGFKNCNDFKEFDELYLPPPDIIEKYNK